MAKLCGTDIVPVNLRHKVDKSHLPVVLQAPFKTVTGDPVPHLATEIGTQTQSFEVHYVLYRWRINRVKWSLRLITSILFCTVLLVNILNVCTRCSLIDIANRSRFYVAISISQ